MNPEAVTCSMAHGKLYIQAPVNTSEASERMLTIDCQTVKTRQSETTRLQHHTDDPEPCWTILKYDACRVADSFSNTHEQK